MGLFRLALAFSVLLGHSGGHGFFGLGFLDRQLAVECFFIISGFYMALVLNEKYLGPGRYWTFIQQRFLRLYPTYFILLVAILLLDGAVSLYWHQPFASMEKWVEYWPTLTPGSIALFIAANLVVLGQDVLGLLSLDHATGDLSFQHAGPDLLSCHWFMLNRPSWSLSVEFCFYLLAPFIVCRSVKFQAGLLLASVALRIALGYFIGSPAQWTHVWPPPNLTDATPWNYSFFPPNLSFFLAGSLGYVFYRDYHARIEKALAGFKFHWPLILFGFIVATYTRLPFAHQLYLLVIPLTAVMVPVLFTATRTNRTDRLIGELSYPFYLIHQHVLIYFEPYFDAHPRAETFHGPVCIVVTTLLAYLFFRFIETRTELFREGLYRKAKNRGLVRKDAPLADDVQPTVAK